MHSAILYYFQGKVVLADCVKFLTFCCLTIPSHPNSLHTELMFKENATSLIHIALKAIQDKAIAN